MTKRFDGSEKAIFSLRVKCSLHVVLCMAAVISFSCFPRHASAGQGDAQDDVFVPTSAWLVGPATLAPAAGARAPCVMANQFNNGFLFRFSGGDKKIYAMAVDFRQRAFTPGKSYVVDLAVGDRFHRPVNADAYDAATLLVNLQDQPGLYGQLASGDTLSLGLGRKTFEFAMLGANDGLKRMEACFNPAGASGAQQDSGLKTGMQSATVPRVPPIARDSDRVDPGYRQALGNTALGNTASGRDDALPDDTAPDASQADSAQLDASLGMHTLSGKPPAPQAKAQAAAAPDESGPDGLVDRMLKKAAVGIGGLSGAGGAMGMQTALTPQPPRVARMDSGAGVSPRIQGADEPDARYQGVTVPNAAVSPAVPEYSTGGALAESWTSTSVRQGAARRGVMFGANRVIPVEPDAQPDAPSPAPAPDRQWRAMSGSNLRDILTLWAQNEHADLKWDANRDYSVKQSVSMDGGFEKAVQGVLGQYAGDDSRPVGQLYRDPATGQKVLLIRQQ